MFCSGSKGSKEKERRRERRRDPPPPTPLPAKRYTVVARHLRDTLAYGDVAGYTRVIQAVERKMDQYEDESPLVDVAAAATGGGVDSADGGDARAAPISFGPPKSPGAAFVAALFDMPDAG